MKINLDDLTRPEQVQHVIDVLARRVTNRKPSEKALYASDLMKRFKVPHLTTHSKRLAFFNELQREAVTEMLARVRRQAEAVTEMLARVRRQAEAAASPAPSN